VKAEFRPFCGWIYPIAVSRVVEHFSMKQHGYIKVASDENGSTFSIFLKQA